MATSKKHYERFAKRFKARIDYLRMKVATDVLFYGEQRLAEAVYLANEIATLFSVDNAAFDRDRFLKACGLTEEEIRAEGIR